MELNEIKKAIYRQNPTAELVNINKSGILYQTFVAGEFDTLVNFLIPLDDLGDAEFYESMEAKHLIRWINKE